MSGVAWALVAAVGFGVTQTLNRKANQLTDAFRTAFGLLLFVEAVLVLRAVATGEIAYLATLSLFALGTFGLTTLLHFVVGWTLVALSQQRIGVARTGALVSAAPLIGSVLAAMILGEPLTPLTAAGVLLAVVGVALISLSGAGVGRRVVWTRPWLALTVATIWGTTPLLIRVGLRHFDHPVMGLTVGLGVSLLVHAAALTLAGAWRRQAVPARAVGWMAAGGITGAVGISAQWISFDLTTIAVAITVQQLAALVVVGLVPLMFHEPFERLTALLIVGTVAMLSGTALVVLAS